MKNYDDIITLPRPKSKHQALSMHQRAAQFLPFSALEGYEEFIEKAGLDREDTVVICEEEINRALQNLKVCSLKPLLNVTYFDDEKVVCHCSEYYKTMDEGRKLLILRNGKSIAWKNLIQVEWNEK